MPGFLGRIRPAFVFDPSDPFIQIEEIDRQLTALTLIPADARTPVEWSKLDVLLDRRNRLRPARVTAPADVPYVPGGAS